MPASSAGWLGNLDPALEHAWHPVALGRSLLAGGWLQVRLLGRTWTLRRTRDGLATDPPAFGVRERHGVVELAPAEPLGPDLDVPELGDRRFVSGWLPAVRSPGAAAVLADELLGAAHPTSIGEPPVASLDEEPGGFTGVRDVGGERVTAAFRVPFQLRLRVEGPATGVVSTALFMLQPEDGDSTRIYSRLLLSAGPGRPLPAPSHVVQKMAALHERLQDVARFMADIAVPGLPLDPPDELRVPADRLGLALRHALFDFTVTRRAHTAA
jgi:hypothetical protein